MKIYIVNAKKLLSKFDRLLEKRLEIFYHSQTLIMDILKDLKNTLGQINSATNDVADDIAVLIEKASGGISAADAAAFSAELTEAAARLRGVASAYPTAPVPAGTIPGAELPSGGLEGGSPNHVDGGNGGGIPPATTNDVPSTPTSGNEAPVSGGTVEAPSNEPPVLGDPSTYSDF